MNPQDGRNMDRLEPGSVKRARERAAAGLPRSAIPPDEPQIARPSAPRQPAAGVPRGVPISRPSPAPQWPLPGPIAAPAPVDGEPYQPSPERPAPQRPPRPSQVPSILDASKVQDHTPVFQYQPRSGRESAGQESLVVPETPSAVSRPSTLSSVASLSDFPLPIQVPSGPPRRSVTLGPPPSARRGASSFYSNASFVSPIPEESPRSRSHASYASSAAMPENWGSPSSPGPSPDYPDPVYGEAIAEESVYGEDDAEESRLVRNASIGKRAKPTLVSSAPSRGLDGAERDQRPGPQPIQGQVEDATPYVQHSSSSGTLPAVARPPVGSSVTPDTMLNAYSSASSGAPSNSSQRSTPSPNPAAAAAVAPTYSRFSAIRRPPRLDIDAVRKAEARGSLTSLPDLIRRATRLAASLEKGRRPASRFDDLDDFSDPALNDEKHRSGLSDMLAAFPPPAHLAPAQNRRSIRDSIRDQVQSWPLPYNFNRTLSTSQEAVPNSDSQQPDPRSRRRRCCGLPMWAFILVMIIVLILIAAAVVIPVEFFVVRKNNNNNQAQQDLQRCRQQLTCANGGTNVVNQGVCSCTCATGFTGADCTAVADTGCTTLPLGSNAGNVTVGDAIPRLIQQAQTNFSIPLTANGVLSKFSSGNLSCSAQNALVTFDGHATRLSQAAAAAAAADVPDAVNAAIVDGVLFTTITVVIAPLTTFTLSGPVPTIPAGAGTAFSTDFTSNFATTISVGRQSSSSPTRAPTATSSVTTTMTMSSAMPTSTFAVSEDVLDFARVAVLFILQEDSLTGAEGAQMALQKVFGSATPTGSSSWTSTGGGVSVEAARNVTVGGGRSVDLVDFVVDMGGSIGKVGRVSGISRRAAGVGGDGSMTEERRRRSRLLF